MALSGPTSPGFQPLMSVVVKSRNGAPRPQAYFRGVLWGSDGGSFLYRSRDNGATWETRVAAPAGTCKRILPTADNRILYINGNGVYKGSGEPSDPGWDYVLDTSAGTATTASFQADGYDGKFIVCHYSNTREDSRYAWISLDNGKSWRTVWDSADVNPDLTDSHIHGVCYDHWDDAFYLVEGHGPAIGVYKSVNNGESWFQVPDRNGLLLGTGAPTVIQAATGGIVMGSDNANDGIWVLRRGDDTYVQAWRWKTEYAVLNGFATSGYREETTGVVYVAFRSDAEGYGAPIAASDGISASAVWTDPVSEGDWSVVVVTQDQNLRGFDRFSGDRLITAKAGSRGQPLLTENNTDEGSAEDATAVAAGISSVAVPQSVAVGASAINNPDTPANDNKMVAIGYDAETTRVGCIACGYQAEASGAYTVAIGMDAIASKTEAVAVGREASAAGNGGVALGNGASTSTWLRAVALGQDSAVQRSDSVSVGPRDVEVTAADHGIILQKPGGGACRITVNDSDEIVVTAL